MKLQVYSDLHIEFYKYFPQITCYADILVLAGDIGILTEPNYVEFLQYISKKWKNIIYVPGNHEYYCDNDIAVIKAQYLDIFSTFDNIHYLDNMYVIIGEGDNKIRFIGSTLWSNPDYIKGLCDFDKIKETRDGKLIPMSLETFKKMHQESIEYIKHTLEYDKSIKTVVVTHFPPISNGTTHPKYSYSAYINYFSNSLSKMNIPTNNICTWISGHTHYSHSFNIDGCRFMSNQLGYSDEMHESRVAVGSGSVIEV